MLLIILLIKYFNYYYLIHTFIKNVISVISHFYYVMLILKIEIIFINLFIYLIYIFYYVKLIMKK